MAIYDVQGNLIDDPELEERLNAKSEDDPELEERLNAKSEDGSWLIEAIDTAGTVLRNFADNALSYGRGYLNGVVGIPSYIGEYTSPDKWVSNKEYAKREESPDATNADLASYAKLPEQRSAIQNVGVANMGEQEVGYDPNNTTEAPPDVNAGINDLNFIRPYKAELTLNNGAYADYFVPVEGEESLSSPELTKEAAARAQDRAKNIVSEVYDVVNQFKYFREQEELEKQKQAAAAGAGASVTYPPDDEAGMYRPATPTPTDPNKEVFINPKQVWRGINKDFFPWFNNLIDYYISDETKQKQKNLSDAAFHSELEGKAYWLNLLNAAKDNKMALSTILMESFASMRAGWKAGAHMGRILEEVGAAAKFGKLMGVSESAISFIIASFMNGTTDGVISGFGAANDAAAEYEKKHGKPIDDETYWKIFASVAGMTAGIDIAMGPFGPDNILVRAMMKNGKRELVGELAADASWIKKALTFGGKTTVAGATEAGEEGYQSKFEYRIKQAYLDEPIDSKRERGEFALGTFTGGLMGTGMHAATSWMERPQGGIKEAVNGKPARTAETAGDNDPADTAGPSYNSGSTGHAKVTQPNMPYSANLPQQAIPGAPVDNAQPAPGPVEEQPVPQPMELKTAEEKEGYLRERFGDDVALASPNLVNAIRKYKGPLTSDQVDAIGALAVATEAVRSPKAPLPKNLADVFSMLGPDKRLWGERARALASKREAANAHDEADTWRLFADLVEGKPLEEALMNFQQDPRTGLYTSRLQAMDDKQIGSAVAPAGNTQPAPGPVEEQPVQQEAQAMDANQVGSAVAPKPQTPPASQADENAKIQQIAQQELLNKQAGELANKDKASVTEIRSAFGWNTGASRQEKDAKIRAMDTYVNKEFDKFKEKIPPEEQQAQLDSIKEPLHSGRSESNRVIDAAYKRLEAARNKYNKRKLSSKEEAEFAKRRTLLEELGATQKDLRAFDSAVRQANQDKAGDAFRQVSSMLSAKNRFDAIKYDKHMLESLSKEQLELLDEAKKAFANKDYALANEKLDAGDFPAWTGRDVDVPEIAFESTGKDEEDEDAGKGHRAIIVSGNMNTGESLQEAAASKNDKETDTDKALGVHKELRSLEKRFLSWKLTKQQYGAIIARVKYGNDPSKIPGWLIDSLDNMGRASQTAEDVLKWAYKRYEEENLGTYNPKFLAAVLQDVYREHEQLFVNEKAKKPLKDVTEKAQKAPPAIEGKKPEESPAEEKQVKAEEPVTEPKKASEEAPKESVEEKPEETPEETPKKTAEEPQKEDKKAVAPKRWEGKYITDNGTPNLEAILDYANANLPENLSRDDFNSAGELESKFAKQAQLQNADMGNLSGRVAEIIRNLEEVGARPKTVALWEEALKIVDGPAKQEYAEWQKQRSSSSTASAWQPERSNEKPKTQAVVPGRAQETAPRESEEPPAEKETTPEEDVQAESEEQKRVQALIAGAVKSLPKDLQASLRQAYEGKDSSFEQEVTETLGDVRRNQKKRVDAQAASYEVEAENAETDTDKNLNKAKSRVYKFISERIEREETQKKKVAKEKIIAAAQGKIMEGRTLAKRERTALENELDEAGAQMRKGENTEAAKKKHDRMLSLLHDDNRNATIRNAFLSAYDYTYSKNSANRSPHVATLAANVAKTVRNLREKAKADPSYQEGAYIDDTDLIGKYLDPDITPSADLGKEALVWKRMLRILKGESPEEELKLSTKGPYVSAEPIVRTPQVDSLRSELCRTWGKKTVNALENSGALRLCRNGADAAAKRAVDMAEAEGIPVKEAVRDFYSRIDDSKSVEGFYDPVTGKAYINGEVATKDTVNAIIAHEIGVHMARDSRFREQVDPMITEGAELIRSQAAKGDYLAKRALRRLERSPDQSDEELVAYFVSEYTQAKGLARPAVKTWLGKLIQTIRDFVKRAFGMPTVTSDRLVGFFQNMVYELATNRGLRVNDDVLPAGGKFSFAGMKGMANLVHDPASGIATAEDMEKEGIDKAVIKRATGWERGADGKWRHELPDVKIKPKFLSSDGKYVVFKGRDYFGVLGDFLSENNDLIRAYPGIANIKFASLPDDLDTYGSFSSNKAQGLITVNSLYSDKGKSVRSVDSKDLYRYENKSVASRLSLERLSKRIGEHFIYDNPVGSLKKAQEAYARKAVEILDRLEKNPFDIDDTGYLGEFIPSSANPINSVLANGYGMDENGGIVPTRYDFEDAMAPIVMYNHADERSFKQYLETAKKKALQRTYIDAFLHEDEPLTLDDKKEIEAHADKALHFYWELWRLADELEPYAERFYKALKQDPETIDTAAAIARERKTLRYYQHEIDKINEAADSVEEQTAYPVRSFMNTLVHEIQHFIQREEGFGKGGNALSEGGVKNYRRLAGEVEARNVERRQEMSEIEKRETLAEATEDVPRSDQIVKFSISDDVRRMYDEVEAEELEKLSPKEREIVDNLTRSFPGKFRGLVNKNKVLYGDAEQLIAKERALSGKRKDLENIEEDIRETSKIASAFYHKDTKRIYLPLKNLAIENAPSKTAVKGLAHEAFHALYDSDNPDIGGFAQGVAEAAFKEGFFDRVAQRDDMQFQQVKETFKQGYASFNSDYEAGIIPALNAENELFAYLLTAAFDTGLAKNNFAPISLKEWQRSCAKIANEKYEPNDFINVFSSTVQILNDFGGVDNDIYETNQADERPQVEKDDGRLRRSGERKGVIERGNIGDGEEIPVSGIRRRSLAADSGKGNERSVGRANEKASGEVREGEETQSESRGRVRKNPKFSVAQSITDPSEQGVLSAGERANQIAAEVSKPNFVTSFLQKHLGDEAAIAFDSLLNVLKKFGYHNYWTNQLCELASKYMPAMKDFARSYARFSSRRGELERAGQSIYAAWKQLDSDTQNAVDEFLYDSQMEYSGKWAYVPEWLPTATGKRGGKSAKQTAMDNIDATLKARFDALPKEAREVIDAVYHHGYDTLMLKKQGLNRLREKLHLPNHRVYNVTGWAPYAPLLRTGHYQVVWKSNEFMETDKKFRALINDKDADIDRISELRKKLTELKKDERHYSVERFDSLLKAQMQASRMNRKNVGKDGISLGEAYAYPLLDANNGRTTVKEREAFAQAIKDKIRSRYEQGGLANTMSEAINALVEDAYEKDVHNDTRKRIGVHGASRRMMDAFLRKSRQDASMISNLEYGHDALEDLSRCKEQNRRNISSMAPADVADSTQLLNELIQRYQNATRYTPPGMFTILADNLRGWTGFRMLATSGSYYLHNALQPTMMTFPELAGRFGAGKASEEFNRAYKEYFSVFGKAMNHTKGIGKLRRFGSLVNNLKNAELTQEEKRMLTDMINLSQIDMGLDQEMGVINGNNAVTRSMAKIYQGTTDVARGVEILNRYVTAMSSFRLAYADNLSRGMDKETAYNNARDYTHKVLYTTQGDYNAYNAPPVFNTALGKVALQFRKFQAIQIAYFFDQFHRALGNRKSAEELAKMSQSERDAYYAERSIARHQLMWSLATHFAMGGFKGLPAMSTLGVLLGAAFGDDDEDWETSARRGLKSMGYSKDAINALMLGLPSIFGLDLSTRVGANDMLSIAPFAKKGLDEQDGAMYYASALMGAGPGLIFRAVDGFNNSHFIDAIKGYEPLDNIRPFVEAVSPSIVTNAMRASGLFDITKSVKTGERMLAENSLGFGANVLMLLGYTPGEVREVYELYRAYNKEKSYLSAKKQELVRHYMQGNKASAMKTLVSELKEYNATAKKRGFQTLSVSDIMKAAATKKRNEEKKIAMGGIRAPVSDKKAVDELKRLY